MKFQAGQKIITTGTDINCYEVKIEVTFVEYVTDNENFDCVIRTSEGNLMYSNSESL